MGAYRGVGVNALGNSISWALYFAFYGRLKTAIEAYQGSLSYYDFFIASGAAGAQLYSKSTLVISFDQPFRCTDCHLYKSRVGHQDTYAINIIEASWSVYVHVRWRATHFSIRGCIGLLPWIGPINHRSLARSTTVYGL